MALVCNGFFRFRQFRVRQPQLTECKDAHKILFARYDAVTKVWIAPNCDAMDSFIVIKRFVCFFGATVSPLL